MNLFGFSIPVTSIPKLALVHANAMPTQAIESAELAAREIAKFLEMPIDWQDWDGSSP